MQNFNPEHYDEWGLRKLSISFYLTLLFLVRPYLIWLISITDFKGQLDIIDFFYENKYLFSLNLLPGIGAVLLIVALSKRKIKSSLWPRQIWNKGKVLLWVSVSADLLLSLWQLKMQQFHYSLSLSMVLVFQLWIIIYLFSSRNLGLFFHEWPEENH